jgi:hypothetical protein
MHASGTIPLSAGALLAEAESHTRMGEYDEALDILRCTPGSASGEH